MYAVEFDARSNNGLIEISQHLSRLFFKPLHVVVMLKDDVVESKMQSTVNDLEAGYQAMAADTEREQDAKSWSNGLMVSQTHETW
jgi:hypothetical protein